MVENDAKKVFTQKVETFAILQAWQCLFTRFHSNTFYSVCELASTTTSQFLVQIHKHLHSCFSANMCEGNYGYELASTSTSHVLVQMVFVLMTIVEYMSILVHSLHNKFNAKWPWHCKGILHCVWASKYNHKSIFGSDSYLKKKIWKF